MTKHSSRTEALQAMVSSDHFRSRRDPSANPSPGEVELTSSWGCELAAPATPLTERMVADFHTFCDSALKVTLNRESQTTAPRVIWRLLPGEPAAFDPQAPKTETFELEIAPERIEIRAHHERGLLHGTHRLEWLMADRGGPFLTPQVTPFSPAFMPRISNGIFIPGHQRLQDPGYFSDGYLGLMSHYGVNGIHLYLDLWCVFKSAALPELNVPDFDAQIAALRELNRRSLAYGIDLYLHLNTPPLPETHAVFEKHPDARGGRVEIFMEELSGRPWHNLCSGSATVHLAYAETVEAVLTAAPEVAGAVMIIGGECFYHCFTRPAGAQNGEASCPHCHGKSPSVEVARLVNTVAQAVKKTGRQKALYAWPYSAFIWSSKDPHQLDWIDHLNPEVSVLTNFDGGDEVSDGVRCFDYNITKIGPSALFADQAQRLQAKSRPIFSKTETCTTPEAFFLPYLPVHHRWQARFAAMRKTGVAGFIGQWRFYGMNGSLPEELQYRATWEEPAGDCPLERIVRRDFHLPPDAACEVVKGWRLLSEAWDFFPYSAMTCGERAAYMRGPLYLGPAHPLIFDAQDSYQLPLTFRLIRGDAAEIAPPEELEELQRRAKPRYICDLLVTLPYGVDRYLELLAQCRTRWNEGLALLRRHLSPESRSTEAAQKELGICETIGCHLATLENVVRFYQLRDRLQGQPTSESEFRSRIAQLQEIATEEIANAERMLPILERDPRIGYGHCYGEVYDAEMVKAKIAQCRYVRDVELPRISDVIRFHIWLKN